MSGVHVAPGRVASGEPRAGTDRGQRVTCMAYWYSAGLPMSEWRYLLSVVEEREVSSMNTQPSAPILPSQLS